MSLRQINWWQRCGWWWWWWWDRLLSAVDSLSVCLSVCLSVLFVHLSVDTEKLSLPFPLTELRDFWGDNRPLVLDFWFSPNSPKFAHKFTRNFLNAKWLHKLENRRFSVKRFTRVTIRNLQALQLYVAYRLVALIFPQTVDQNSEENDKAKITK